MKATEIKSCYIGPVISPEQFIKEHFFLYLAKGLINGYDGYKHYILKPGESCMVLKNNLARYNKLKEEGEFEKVVFIFDEAFLKRFQEKYDIKQYNHKYKSAFFMVRKDAVIDSFLLSLAPYFTNSGEINSTFSDLKREELLHILLQLHPELSASLFDFGIPGRMDIEEFMQKNYKFNVSISHFAYLTGRSLSAFKRDFKTVFNDTPSRWLIKKRLQEAFFLIKKKNKKPSDIYLELGFESLSHFSVAFKKHFGYPPSTLV